MAVASPQYLQPTITMTGQSQTFLYPANQSISQFQLFNSTVAGSSNPSFNCFELINSSNNGFRLRQQITSTSVYGNLIVERFSGVSLPGIPYISFNETGTITTTDSIFVLQNNTDTTKQIQFSLSGITTGTTRTLTIQNANGTVAYLSNSLDQFAIPVGNLNINLQNIMNVGTVQFQRLTSTYALPTLAGGSAAGGSPTLAITGTELCGIISVTTGTSPSGTLILTGTPYVALPNGSGFPITPANAAAAALGNSIYTVVASGGTSFTINTTTTLTASTLYKWNFHT